MLYTYNTLNNEDFKSGRYVEFAAFPSEVITNVSRYLKEGDNIIYYPRFYKLKLLHQLNNGYLDLTKDVWTKFHNVVRSTPFWFSNDSFKYYCPSQFKGKLVSSLEIEDLYKFNIFQFPTIYLNLDQTYKFSVDVDAIAVNASDLTKIGTNCITIPKLKFETWYDDPTVITTKYENTATLYSTKAIYAIDDIVYLETTKDEAKIRTYYKNLTGVNNPILTDINDWELYTEYLTINNIPSNKLNTYINYKITPVLGILGQSTIYEGGVGKDLPDEFINKYTISGKRKITTEFDNITFKKVSSNYDCDLTRGVKIYNEYILTNINGAYLDANLEISAIPYIFLRQGTSSITPSSVIINSYTVANRKPVLVTPAVTPVSDDFILELFEITEVEENSEECVAVTYPTLNINFNINLSPLTSIKIYQSDELVYSVAGLTTASVSSSVNSVDVIVIEVVRPGYKTIKYSMSPISGNTTISLGFIADAILTNNYNFGNNSSFRMIWENSEGLPTIPTTLTYTMYFNTGTVSSTLAVSSSTRRETINYDGLQYGFLSAAELTAGSTTVPDNTYANIPSGTAATVDGTIFNKTVYWET